MRWSRKRKSRRIRTITIKRTKQQHEEQKDEEEMGEGVLLSRQH
jgi:hypothetical protein